MKHIFLLAFSLIVFTCSQAQEFAPEWNSLDNREIPEWFMDAKFGILVNWGIYSVPSYRPYPLAYEGYAMKEGVDAEWYVPEVLYQPDMNNDFHRRAYGEDFTYFDFLPMFRAELFDAEEWAGLFRSTGARYVILNAKHNDGFAMWPTEDKYSASWNCSSLVPGRDLVGELTKEVRAKGMKMGLYYSFMEFWSTKTRVWPADDAKKTGYYVPEAVWDKYHIPEEDYVNHIHFQVKELVNKYSPDILWMDGEKDYSENALRSRELLAWIYNEAPNKERIVVNDRWAAGTRGNHGDYYTTGYGSETENLKAGHPWEKCMTMGYSFGYNRAEQLEDFKSSDDLIEELAKTIAKGGNFLLNVGPAADGTIPLVMKERLQKIGKWVSANKEAIYNTRPYVPDTSLWIINPKAGEDILFTTDSKYIYIFLSDWNIDAVSLKEFNIGKYSRAEIVSTNQIVDIDFKRSGIVLNLPSDRKERVSVVRIESIAEKASRKEKEMKKEMKKEKKDKKKEKSS